MEKIIGLNLNYFAVIGTDDFNTFMKMEFYKAKEYLFSLGYEEYVEEKSLPINPKDQNIFSPLATYRVKDIKGNFDWINIFARGFGGMLVTNKL